MSRIVPNIELQGQAGAVGSPNQWTARAPIVCATRRGVLTAAEPLSLGVVAAAVAAVVAPETRASTTTLVNSTQLQAAIPTAGTYAFKIIAYLYSTTAVTDGVTANVNYSGNFTAAGSYYGGYASYTGGLTNVQPAEVSSTVNSANSALTSITLGTNAAAPSVQAIEGTLVATGAGTLAYAFAQSVSGSDTCNLALGSYMTVTRVA